MALGQQTAVQGPTLWGTVLSATGLPCLKEMQRCSSLAMFDLYLQIDASIQAKIVIARIGSVTLFDL